MRRARPVLLVAALLLFTLTPIHTEDRPYFALSSDRTWAPGETPVVHLWGENIPALEFRVYRVNDPVKFFQTLQDVHSFGGRVPEMPRVVSPIERFHQIKKGWRDAIRDLFREQFSEDSRAHIRDRMLARERRSAAAAADFATVPVLNPQQLVSTWRENIGSGWGWAERTVPLRTRGKGLYLVEAVRGDQRAYTVVLITDLIVVTKTSPGRILAATVDRQTGAPVPGGAVFFWSDKKEVARATADDQGLADARLSARRPENTLVLAKRDDDFAVDSLNSWSLSSDPDRYFVGYVYTDRPVYRPGHAIHFKGILRTQAGARYRLPEHREIYVEIHDPDNNPVYRNALKLSELGTVDDDYTLSGSAALGYYSIEIRAGDSKVEGGFHVEEYKKPEYLVSVTPDARRVLQGDAIRATIEAHYYFGEPVPGAKVTWVVHRSRYWSYALYGEEEEEFEGGGDEEGGEGDEGDYGAGEQVGEQSGRLDAQGRLVITVPTAVARDKHDMLYRIEARVTDESNREIAGFASTLATYGSFLVTVRADRYLYGPGETAAFLIRARDYDGKPVSTKVRLMLSTWTWYNRPARSIGTFDAETDAQGEAKVEAPFPEGGSYLAKVVATTPEGRDVEDETYVWVAGESSAWISGRESERIQIVPDRPKYRAGETAHVLIITGVPDSHVLVTTEGRELHTHRMIALQGPTVTVDVPILPEYAPNVYVAAVFVRGNRIHQGAKAIKVPPVEQQLTVEIEPSRDTFRPGDAGVFTVSARDFQGKPLAADLSLGVVDEAIYAVQPEMNPDIVSFFYGRGPNRVETDSSFSYYFHGASGKKAMRLTSLRPGSALAALKPQTLVEPRVRKAFPDTALWLAHLTTGPDGRATAKLSFPDSLTTWRATVRGVTRDTQVGNAVRKVVVRKDLILRLVTPRFFTKGDEVTVSAVVHNYLASEKTARVSLQAQGLEMVEGETRDVVLPSRGEARLDWRVRAPAVREVTILGKALTDEESDAMELALPVRPFGVTMTIARSGSVAAADGAASADLEFPGGIDPDSRSLEVQFTPSVAGTIFGALDYLTSFPYGCTEQTMSSFLPNVVVARALKDLGVTSNVDRAALQVKIDKGLQRLYDYQHEDGGWGWWQTDDSHAFMTAYVLSGLSQARAAAVEVRPEAVQRARDWLKTQFDRSERVLPDLRAYMALALTEAGLRDAKVLDAVWSERTRLSPYGVALAGLALLAAGDTRAEDAAALLEAGAVIEVGEAHWQVDRNDLMEFEGDTSAEATAYAVKLLTRLRPASPLLPKAALWLVNHRDQGDYWCSTEQTAMVIFGLTDYLKASGELKPDFHATVFVNDREVLTRRFTAGDALATAPAVVHLPAADLPAGKSAVRVSKTGRGTLYWSARATYVSSEKRLEKSGSVSLNLLRDYYRLVPEQKGETIVHRLVPLEGELHPGDLLVGRLTLSGGRWRYLMIEDPIPAGTEFVKRDDLYEIVDRPPWWTTYWTRREQHDDRAAFFETYFDGRQTQYLYLLKVVNPGLFKVGPARVSPMYQPQYFATSEAREVTIR